MANPTIRREDREAARAALHEAGISIRAVANELGVHHSAVLRVLSSDVPCTRGQAHKIAVALGLKQGVVAPEGLTPSETVRAAMKRRAS